MHRDFRDGTRRTVKSVGLLLFGSAYCSQIYDLGITKMNSRSNTERIDCGGSRESLCLVLVQMCAITQRSSWLAMQQV
jgi:hypothetical protein